MDYCLLHQMNIFGPKNFDFHAWVKKCHFGNFSEFSKIAKIKSIKRPFRTRSKQCECAVFKSGGAH